MEDAANVEGQASTASKLYAKAQEGGRWTKKHNLALLSVAIVLIVLIVIVVICVVAVGSRGVAHDAQLEALVKVQDQVDDSTEQPSTTTASVRMANDTRPRGLFEDHEDIEESREQPMTTSEARFTSDTRSKDPLKDQEEMGSTVQPETTASERMANDTRPRGLVEDHEEIEESTEQPLTTTATLRTTTVTNSKTVPKDKGEEAKKKPKTLRKVFSAGTENEMQDLVVTCDGVCKNVTVRLATDSGDADLFISKTRKPKIVYEHDEEKDIVVPKCGRCVCFSTKAVTETNAEEDEDEEEDEGADDNNEEESDGDEDNADSENGYNDDNGDDDDGDNDDDVDICTDFKVNRDRFYVTVYAFSDYEKAKLEVVADNLKKLKRKS